MMAKYYVFRINIFSAKGFGQGVDSSMPRILGVDVPNNKPTYISLTYLYGVGKSTAIKHLLYARY